MKALFLAGGTGTKLRPLTDKLPKSMVPIMNRPLLERSMANLRKCGISEILISYCNESKYIKEYFSDGSRFGLRIEYINEDIPLGTGGAIKKAGMMYHDTFLVLNADVVCNIDYKELIDFHKSKSASITVAVIGAETLSSYEVVESDKNDYAVSFGQTADDKEIKSVYVNAGVYVVEPEMLNEIPEDRPVSLKREILPALLQKGYKVAAYKGCSYWMDIVTPENYLQTHQDILSGKCQISGVHFGNNNIFKDGKSIIDNTAIINGPIYIGDNVKIGAYATVGPNAVIGDDVSIHMGGKVLGSILWNNVDIGICAKLVGAVATSDCKVGRKSVHSDMAFTKTESVTW
jgi:mannose-1-phosphate guanylyltransferase